MVKVKVQRRRVIRNDRITNLFLVIAAGGVLGITAAVVLANRKPKNWRTELYDTCEDLSERGQEMAHDAVEKGSEYVNNIREKAGSWMDEHPTPKSHLLTGLLGGALLGAATIYLLTKESEPEGIATKFKTAGRNAADSLRSVDWMETAKEVFQLISDKVAPERENLDANLQSKVDDVLKWANIGFSVWQNLQKRR